MAMEEYFNWYDLFVNRIAGSEAIFIFCSILIIALLCAKFRLPNVVTLFLFLVYALIMSTQIPILLAVTLLIIGMLISFGLSRVIVPK